MRINEYRKQLRETLETLFGEEAPALCDILLCEFMDTDRSGLILMGEDELPEEVALKVDDATDKLGLGVPVQYVIGNCWFCGRKIFVGNGCFIPRSDTEVLAETAAHCIPHGGSFADICSGSGCISAAIASMRDDIKGFALEMSYKALPYTEKNLADFAHVAVKRFDALDDEDYIKLAEENGKVDVIVCNPPYIRTEEIDMLEPQVQFEPHLALDGGEDGLKYYRTVTALAPLILKDEGTLLYEVGYDQAEDVAAILASAGYRTATVKDLAGIERVVLGKKY